MRWAMWCLWTCPKWARPLPPKKSLAEVNEELRGDPSLANTDPLGKGWFFKVKLSNPAQTDALLDETAYKAFSAA
jgi:glycine cleavage system H protein